jgi:hypothetical protein
MDGQAGTRGSRDQDSSILPQLAVARQLRLDHGSTIDYG